MQKKHSRILITAEAGTAHAGSLEAGYRLIDRAAEAGADCVKFQTVFADEILHPLSGKIKLPGGNITLYEQFRQLEQNDKFYEKLKHHAEKAGLIFISTPFGIKSAQILIKLGLRMIKIASPELNHFSLLKEVKNSGAEIILSGGVSTITDIEKAVKITGNDIIFLHCITSYPAPEEEYNLKLIETLSAAFGFRAGISDHSIDPVLVPLLSAAMGAVMVEKHITLDTKGSGLDDPVALDPGNFSIMVKEIRNAQTSSRKEIIEYLSKSYGKEKVLKTLGNGVKQLAESEKENYSTTNRSLLALRNIAAGEIISEKDFAPLRCEKNLKPGLSPDYADFITGKTVKREIKNSEGILLEHFI